jgi:hypothetical protein
MTDKSSGYGVFHAILTSGAPGVVSQGEMRELHRHYDCVRLSSADVQLVQWALDALGSTDARALRSRLLGERLFAVPENDYELIAAD